MFKPKCSYSISLYTANAFLPVAHDDSGDFNVPPDVWHIMAVSVQKQNIVGETYCNHCLPPSFHQWFHPPAAAGGNLVDCTASSRSPSAGALWRQGDRKTERMKPQTGRKS